MADSITTTSWLLKLSRISRLSVQIASEFTPTVLKSGDKLANGKRHQVVENRIVLPHDRCAPMRRSKDLAEFLDNEWGAVQVFLNCKSKPDYGNQLKCRTGLASKKNLEAHSVEQKRLCSVGNLEYRSDVGGCKVQCELIEANWTRAIVLLHSCTPG